MNIIPHNDRVEQAVLGAIMLSPENSHLAIENLTERDFYTYKHKLLFTSMKEIFKEGMTVNLVTVQDYLKRKKLLEQVEIFYVSQLLDTVPTSNNIEDFCDILKRTTYEREIYILTQQYTEGEITFDELTAGIMSFPSLTNRPDEQTLKDLFADTLKNSTKGVAYKFTMEVLERYLGGIDKGETVVIGGYTSQGKTMMGIQLAIDFAEKGFKVLYCTSEMTSQETARRILSNQTEVNIMNFRRGELTLEEKQRISQAGITLGESWDITIKTVRYTSDVTFYTKKYEPDIIFVDHLHNLSRQGNLSDYQRVTQNMDDLQSLALTEKKGIFVLSQLNRKKDEVASIPRLSSLRESGAIEEKANIVLFVHWEKRMKDEVEARQGGEPPEDLKIVISKNRDGVVGRKSLDFYPEYCQIKSPPVLSQENYKERKDLFDGEV